MYTDIKMSVGVSGCNTDAHDLSDPQNLARNIFVICGSLMECFTGVQCSGDFLSPFFKMI